MAGLLACKALDVLQVSDDAASRVQSRDPCSALDPCPGGRRGVGKRSEGRRNRHAKRGARVLGRSCSRWWNARAGLDAPAGIAGRTRHAVRFPARRADRDVDARHLHFARH